MGTAPPLGLWAALGVNIRPLGGDIKPAGMTGAEEHVPGEGEPGGLWKPRLDRANQASKWGP